MRSTMFWTLTMFCTYYVCSVSALLLRLPLPVRLVCWARCFFVNVLLPNPTARSMNMRRMSVFASGTSHLIKHLITLHSPLLQIWLIILQERWGSNLYHLSGLQMKSPSYGEHQFLIILRRTTIQRRNLPVLFLLCDTAFLGTCATHRFRIILLARRLSFTIIGLQKLLMKSDERSGTCSSKLVHRSLQMCQASRTFSMASH